MDLATTSPGLFLTRLAAHLCAPVFVALTGLSAWLYGANRAPPATAAFLAKRGLFLIVLELTVVGFAWSFDFPPPTIFLQVIWAIGLSMLALAALVHMPRQAIAAIGIVIVAGHNLLDPVAFAPGTAMRVIWAVLHNRAMLDLGGVQVRTSYPVLPWIGVIALGYAIGPWFAASVALPARRGRLLVLGTAMLTTFVILRFVDLYGEPTAWLRDAPPSVAAMSFVNLTKYPPSLDFLLFTLGIGALILAAWEGRRGGPLAVFGGAPLFFYIIHLYALHLAHLGASAIVGHRYDVPSIGWIWAIAGAFAPPLWLATRRFARAKRVSERWWMRYL